MTNTIHGSIRRLLALLTLAAGSAAIANPALAVYEEPVSCQISGDGVLQGIPFTSGSLQGTATSGVGIWVVFTDSEFYELVAESVTCRLDGVEIGDSIGNVAGTGYQYFLEVWDAGDGLPATHETLVASRSYSPSEWSDADYPVDDRVGFFLPSELPVTAGDAGGLWAWLRFTRFEEGDRVTCRYRGNDSGTAYAFVRCTGEDDGTLPVTAGDLVSVTTLRLHVQSGCNECGPTQIELDLDVGQGEWDYFLFHVYKPDGSFSATYQGFLTEGNIVVESLDL